LASANSIWDRKNWLPRASRSHYRVYMHDWHNIKTRLTIASVRKL